MKVQFDNLESMVKDESNTKVKSLDDFSLQLEEGEKLAIVNERVDEYRLEKYSGNYDLIEKSEPMSLDELFSYAKKIKQNGNAKMSELIMQFIAEETYEH